MKNIIILILIVLNLYSEDTITAKKQNVLSVQSLIEFEEKIAVNFEKYLLTKFVIPTINQLQTDDYLGSNFSLVNKFGDIIAFDSSSKKRIKYAITKDVEEYIFLLYDRDLYRYNTYVSNETNSKYIEIKLNSKEAENIYSILNNGYTIKENCDTPEKGKYCNKDEKTIRWYNDGLNWIEYSKKDFEDGNVTINEDALTDAKLNNLKVGAYIFIENKGKYIKFLNNQLLKVN